MTSADCIKECEIRYSYCTPTDFLWQLLGTGIKYQEHKVQLWINVRKTNGNREEPQMQIALVYTRPCLPLSVFDLLAS
jgi:hypothetical protein